MLRRTVALVLLGFAGCGGAKLAEHGTTEAGTVPVDAAAAGVDASGEPDAQPQLGASDGGAAEDGAVPTMEGGSAEGGLLVGYYTEWSAHDLPVSAIEWGPLTHIAHAFALPQDGGGIENATTLPNDALVQAAHANGVKVVVSVGGQSASWASVVGSPTSRAATVAALAGFCSQHGYDGVDVDWEFPDQTTIVAWSVMVAELRVALDAIRPGLTVSSTVDDSASNSDIYPVPDLASLDWISAMTYAYANPGSSVVGFYAPLAAPDGGATGSVEATIAHLVARGVPASKLLLGFGFYGEEFRNGPPGATIVSPGDVVVFPQNKIAPLIGQAAWTLAWDPTASESSLQDGKDWISYEDARSIDAKCAYAHASGLGGAMIWHLAFGVFPDGTQPLLERAAGCR
jgi:chitinase